mmetsp:Transcript_28538/g.51651  ORF Transcript_28538/g.51651 Transcript_28538/m.51651 type:complete len:585 (+) Transcript_28538:36-1790(+)
MIAPSSQVMFQAVGVSHLAGQQGSLSLFAGVCEPLSLGSEGNARPLQGREAKTLSVAVATAAAVAGGARSRRRRQRTSLSESISGSFQKAWAQRVPDEWKPDGIRGNWSPVHEEVSGLPVEAIGELPSGLPAGHLLRNGPNPRWVRPLAGYHPFEGDGMLHSIEFKDPLPGEPRRSPRYSNRWVKTAKWYAEDAAQMPLASGMVDDNFARAAANAMLNVMSMAIAAPAVLADKRVHAASKGLGTANTSVIVHAGKCLALQERANPIVMDLAGLETLGALNLKGKFTAHPKICPVTGELMWFSYDGKDIEYGVWDKDGKPTHQTTIHLPHSIMAHDIAVTERYTVILDCPLLLEPENILDGKGPVSFNKEESVRFGVLPRHGTSKDIEWYTLPGKGKACFHVLNAYEESFGDLVVVGCSMPDVSLMDMNVKHADLQRLTEWRINRKTGVVLESIVSSVPCDFPKINTNFAGRPFRFGYAAAFNLSMDHGGVPMFRGVLKHDFTTGKSLVWEAEEATFIGEPSFVPRIGASPEAEDDGYLLAHAYNESSKSSEVVVLSAHSMEHLCRLKLPRRVPYGFHATWVPKA